MLARDMVELATLVALHGSVLAHGGLTIPQQGLEEYWSASKCRFDRWGRALKQASIREAAPDRRQRDAQANFMRGVVEEILAGEVLTRVWAAVMAICDRRQPGCDALPLARSVLVGQQEARCRVLTLLVNGSIVESRQAVELNRLRGHAERWTDLLVGHLCAEQDVGELASDPERARQFGADFRLQGSPAQSLVWASLRASFACGFAAASPNPDLNARIAASVLACFQPELFDSTGLLRSRWMARLWTTTDETQVLLDEWFAEERDDRPASGPLPVHEEDVLFRRRRIL